MAGQNVPPPPQPNLPSREWEKWFEQARREQTTSEVLAATGLWAPACFHALQAIETALKALVRKVTTIEELGTVSIEKLNDMTIGKMAVGGDQPASHRLIALVTSPSYK